MSLFVFKPYADEQKDPLGRVRRACREIFPPALLLKQGDPLRRIRITVIGMETDQEHVDMIECVRLLSAFKECKAAGLVVASDFELLPLTLCEGPSHDFLNPKLSFPTDLLVLSFLRKPPVGRESEVAIFRPQEVSPYYIPGAFSAAAHRAGARAVYLEWFVDEIAPREFTQDATPVLYKKNPVLAGGGTRFVKQQLLLAA